ncbi:class B sortase [Helcococcus kunzii]|uniref:class B sortase n=1 Tax=Helcococcus kunzii TaxID=40091 RepID=UPI0024AD5C77|nr:class B sortase [Helcococcus kunzii]
MNKKKKNIVLTIVQLVLVAIIIYSLYNIGSYYYQNYKSTKALKKITEEVSSIEENILNKSDVAGINNVTGVKNSTGNKNESKEERNIPKKSRDQVAKEVVAKLKERNKDIIGYIKVEGVKIDYPILYTKEDNDYYLFRDLDGNWSRPGNIFLNGWNNPDFSDMNTTVFGHNLRTNPEKYAPMFKLILNFDNEEFVNSKKEHIIEIYTEEGYKKYRIFSGYYSNISNDYMEANRDKRIWVDYLKNIKNKSTHDFGVDYKFSEDTKIVTLSTCDNDTDEGRYVVHAYEIEE